MNKDQTKAASSASHLLCEPGMGHAVSPIKPVLTSGDKVVFRTILEGAASNPNLCVISNRFPWQARIAADKLIEIARGQRLPIRILSGRCHEGFYNSDFANRLRDCKSSGCPFIRVIVWQKSPEGISKCLLDLARSKVIELKVSGSDLQENTVPHFMLVGDRAFRQEAGHPPFTEHTQFTETEPQVPARIDFDDPKTGKVLTALFDNLWGPA